MPLSLDDEIFVEKCFQRTLLVRVVFLHSNQRKRRKRRIVMTGREF
jgi:hypothetical protein